MGETCKGCAKWEEEIYWGHFQSNSFIQFLSGDFHHHLEIPKKFSNNLRKELPYTVELKGPSGAKWNVGLKQNDGNMFFKQGWPEFVKDLSLQENDILAFTYNRDSCFNVLVFNGRNMCEKETSYFFRKCENPGHECGCSIKRKARDNPTEVTHNSPHQPEGYTSSEKSANDDDSFTLPGRRHVIYQAPNKRLQRRTRTNSVQSSQGLRNKDPSSSAVAAMVKRSTGSRLSPLMNSRMQYVSNRRPVTEVEKKNALQLAQAAATDKSFILVLRPSQVYKCFYVAIPTKWVLKHLNPKIQLVTLRVGDRTWDVKYYYNEKHVIGRLTSGWKSFAVDNNLEESDVCVFEAGSLGNNSITVDASIFRVVEEAVPPSRVHPGSKWGRTPKRARKQVHQVFGTDA